MNNKVIEMVERLINNAEEKIYHYTNMIDMLGAEDPAAKTYHEIRRIHIQSRYTYNKLLNELKGSKQ